MKNLEKGDVVITSRGKVGIITIPKMFYVLNSECKVVMAEDFNGKNYFDEKLKEKGYSIKIAEPLVSINGIEFEISENKLTKITKCIVIEDKHYKKFIFKIRK